MIFDYYDLSPSQYEGLVISVCRRLLGAGVQGFSTGPDGGRDARFNGTAQEIPSRTEPWRGKVIVQAKHTSKINAKFNESDFFSTKSDSAVISAEIPKIKKLYDDNELDYYLLFSNRNQSGDIECVIRRFISERTGLADDRIMLCGNELMEDWLKMFPQVAVEAKIDPIDSPLNVSPQELAEVVLLLEKNKELVKSDGQPSGSLIPPRTSFEEKVPLNNMTEGYAETIRAKIPNFRDIQNFLANDDDSRTRYETVVEEFDARIISKRKDYQTFDEVIEHIFTICVRDPDLSKLRKTLRQLLYYMFWFCDIGRNKNAETDET